MKKLRYLSFIIISLVLMACPYEGTVKLNSYEESIKIDKKLIGEWISFDEEGGREEILVEKSSSSVLNFSHRKFGKNNKLKQRFKCKMYSTEIGGHNIFNIENKDNQYIYGEYELIGKNEFNVQLIDADFMNTNFKVDSVTTDNLRAFITGNINKENLFGEKLEFYRKYSPEYEKVKMFMRKSGF